MLTTDATMFDEFQEEVALNEVAKPKHRKPTRARTQPLRVVRNELLDIGARRYICMCWRCRMGGVPKGDMAQMDRILARHLLRMSEAERDDWLRSWAANPNHGTAGESRIRIWMAIERGRKMSEPVYAQKRGE